MERISEAAHTIFAARRSRAPLGQLPAVVRPSTEVEAYRVQEAVHELATPAWGPVVGHKIGCTTPVMQQYLGIANPCAGGVFAGRVNPSGVTLATNDYVRVGIECEIAVRLGRDLPASEAPFMAESVAQAVASCMAAIEIVDDRYADWRQMDTPTLIADDFFAAGCVLGAPVVPEAAPELSEVVGQTFINGVERGRGRGSDVMGHPYAALAWLANHLAGRGRALQAGQIVLTGSLVQTIWLAPGDEVLVTVSGLGSVTLQVEGATDTGLESGSGRES
ncbi:2-keto-4-pentenoate hydratase [Microvirga massiliensis]|uniref:2-keto-4-pentenoate hydratase n=1 Tax=Microvirga massiliensis TaxID=1033741 RepID=UPI00062B77E4|nr:fumarylacetoacetate hydrolase family protein [Microvirga massiliensis]